MKKILVVLLSLTLIFAFTGCTSSNNGAAEDIEIKTQKVVTSNTDDDDDNISNTENAFLKKWLRAESLIETNWAISHNLMGFM